MFGQITLDRASPLPLWAQLLADLRERLTRGEFSERFPTDAELTEAYRVSRQTVRDAVRRLTDDGLVERERGRGTHVRTHSFERAAGTLESLFAYVESQGLRQRNVVRALEARRVPRVARLLAVRRDARLIYVDRLRLIDGEPLAIERSWLPARIAAPLLDADLTRTGIYLELEARCGVTLRSGSERLRPVLPARADRRALALPEGEAALAVSRLTVADAGPVEWREGLVRGDRWSIAVELTPAQPASSPLPWAPASA